MTSADVKFGAKIDSRALNSPHRRTRLASFVLPLTLSSKFAFFPSVDVLHLNRSKDVLPKCVKSRGLRFEVGFGTDERMRSCMHFENRESVAVRRTRNAFVTHTHFM